MDSIGFTYNRKSHILPVSKESIFDYPVYNVKENPIIEKYVDGRTYFNMKLEDFEGYKKHGEQPVLHGPAPYHPIICGCDRYILSSQGCICSVVNQTKPLYSWVMNNIEQFHQKQIEMHRWRHIWELWNEQKSNVYYNWKNATYTSRIQFLILQDKESIIRCASCERVGRDFCICECDDCGNKYCTGCH